MSKAFHNMEVSGAQSAYRLLDVLSGLALHPAGVGLTDLAAALELTPSTVRRLLLVLCDRGFAEQDDLTRMYRLGPQTRILGARSVDREVLRDISARVLRDLRDDSTETVFLSIRDGLEVEYVECLPAIHPVKMYGEPGTRLPLHATSQGKAIMAFLPDLMVDRLTRQMDFEVFADNTISNAADLEVSLKDVRENGYATNIEEREQGVMSVAAPVLDPTGLAVAAVCIGAPALRYSPEELVRQFAPRVIEAGREISRALFPLSEAGSRLKPERGNRG
jgi:DNA-binding IclR family transcriptional regulator